MLIVTTRANSDEKSRTKVKLRNGPSCLAAHCAEKHVRIVCAAQCNGGGHIQIAKKLKNKIKNEIIERGKLLIKEQVAIGEPTG